MFNVGPMELMVLLVLALIVFGPAKLPELMGSVGNAIREFQRASRELTDVFQETQQEFRSAQEEFSSALDLENAANTVTETAVEPSANGHSASEVTTTVPVSAEASATAIPPEYETAARMVDPVDPFPEPAAPEPTISESTVGITSPEMDTAAGLAEAPLSIGATAVAEPVAVADAKPRRTRARKTVIQTPAEPPTTVETTAGSADESA